MFLSLVNLFFPKTCQACSLILSDNELQICVSCRYELPLTNYHYDNSEAIKKIFYGRVELKGATAFVLFLQGWECAKVVA